MCSFLAIVPYVQGRARKELLYIHSMCVIRIQRWPPPCVKHTTMNYVHDTSIHLMFDEYSCAIITDDTCHA